MEGPVMLLFSMFQYLACHQPSELIKSQVHSRAVSVGRVALAIEWTTLFVRVRAEDTHASETVRYHVYRIRVSLIDALRIHLGIFKLRLAASLLFDQGIPPAVAKDTATKVKDLLSLVNTLGTKEQ